MIVKKKWFKIKRPTCMSGFRIEAIPLSNESNINQCLFPEFVITNFFFQICAELNNPSLGPVKAWSGHRGAWTCITAYSEDKQGQVIA